MYEIETKVIFTYHAKVVCIKDFAILYKIKISFKTKVVRRQQPHLFAILLLHFFLIEVLGRVTLS